MHRNIYSSFKVIKDENEVMNYVFAQEKLGLKTIMQQLISEQQKGIPESMGSQEFQKETLC